MLTPKVKELTRAGHAWLTPAPAPRPSASIPESGPKKRILQPEIPGQMALNAFTRGQVVQDLEGIALRDQVKLEQPLI